MSILIKTASANSGLQAFDSLIEKLNIVKQLPHSNLLSDNEKENIILSEIIDFQIKEAKRYGYYSPDIQDKADNTTLKNINFDLFVHIKKLSDSITNKDSYALISLLVYGNNKASQLAFKKITGINLSGLNIVEKERLIFSFTKESNDNINAYYEKRRKKDANKPKKESMAKHFDSELDDFLSSLDAMSKGKAIKTLNTLYEFSDGKIEPLKDRIKKLVSTGAELIAEEVSKIKEMSRLAYHRANNEEQEAHERKMQAAGTKTMYYLGNTDVGKIGYDYANYLIESK